MKKHILTILLVLPLFLFQAVVLHTAEFNDAKKAFKKSMSSRKGDKNEAIRTFAATGEKDAYVLIFVELCSLSKKLWKIEAYKTLADRKKDDHIQLSKDDEAAVSAWNSGKAKKYHDALKTGHEVLKNVKDPNIVPELFKGATKKSKNFLHFTQLKESGLFEAMVRMQNSDAVESVLKQSEKIDLLLRKYNVVWEKIKNKPPTNFETHSTDIMMTKLDDVLAHISDALSKVSDPAAIDTLVKDGLNHKSLGRRIVAVNALSQMKGDRPMQEVVDRLKIEKNEELKLLALRKIYIDELKAAEPAVIALLEDPSEKVRIAAATALEVIGSNRAIKALIDILAKTVPESLTAAAFAESLARLTPEDMGPLYQEWKAWMDKNRKKLGMNDQGEIENVTYTGNDREPRPGSQAGTFFNITYDPSSDVIFIIDISGSMSTPMAGGTRMIVAKNELVKAIGGLNDAQFFNIITFSSGVGIWQPGRMVKATKENKDKAKSFAQMMGPAGATNISGALMKAFSLGEEYEKYQIGTIFLLTDGEPSAGMTDPKAILFNVEKMNRKRKPKVKINTISLGGSGASLLQSLAAQNGGQFTSR